MQFQCVQRLQYLKNAVSKDISLGIQRSNFASSHYTVCTHGIVSVSVVIPFHTSDSHSRNWASLFPQTSPLIPATLSGSAWGRQWPPMPYWRGRERGLLSSLQRASAICCTSGTSQGLISLTWWVAGIASLVSWWMCYVTCKSCDCKLDQKLCLAFKSITQYQIAYLYMDH